MQADGWAKVPKIAEYMGMSPRTVRDLLKQGLRHSRMPSGTILVKYAWVDSFLEQFEDDGGKRVDDIVNSVMKDF